MTHARIVVCHSATSGRPNSASTNFALFRLPVPPSGTFPGATRPSAPSQVAPASSRWIPPHTSRCTALYRQLPQKKSPGQLDQPIPRNIMKQRRPLKTLQALLFLVARATAPTTSANAASACRRKNSPQKKQSAPSYTYNVHIHVTESAIFTREFLRMRSFERNRGKTVFFVIHEVAPEFLNLSPAPHEQ
jgi:hypothetical protein